MRYFVQKLSAVLIFSLFVSSSAVLAMPHKDLSEEQQRATVVGNRPARALTGMRNCLCSDTTILFVGLAACCGGLDFLIYWATGIKPSIPGAGFKF